MQPILLQLSTKQILVEFQDYFHQYNFFVDILRSLGWVITKFLKVLCDGMESFVDKAYQLLNFTASSNVNSFLTKLGPLLYISFAIGILGLGIHLILGNNRDNKIVTNLLLAVLVTSSLPLLMKNGNDLVLTFRQAVIQEDAGKTSNALIKSGIADLRYMESKKFKFKKKTTEPLNNIKSGNISLININETIEPSGFRLFGTIQIDLDVTDGDGWSISLSDGGPFANYLDINEKGQRKVKEISNVGFLGIFPPAYYYRYDVQFINIWIALISNIFVLFFSSYKVIKIIFNLVFAQIFTMFLAGTDLTNGQRLRKALENIISSYVVLLLMTMIHKFYLLGVAYINSQSWNGIEEAFFILFIALAVIDAPDIVEKVLGIDAGISKGAGVITSAYYGSQMARGMAGMVFGTKNPETGKRQGGLYGLGKSILKGGVEGGLYHSGRVKGMMDEYAEREKQKRMRRGVIYQGGEKRESLEGNASEGGGQNPEKAASEQSQEQKGHEANLAMKKKDSSGVKTSGEKKEAGLENPSEAGKSMAGETGSKEKADGNVQPAEASNDSGHVDGSGTPGNEVGLENPSEAGKSMAGEAKSKETEEGNVQPAGASNNAKRKTKRKDEKGFKEGNLGLDGDARKGKEEDMTSRDVLGERNLDSNPSFSQGNEGEDSLKNAGDGIEKPESLFEGKSKTNDSLSEESEPLRQEKGQNPNASGEDAESRKASFDKEAKNKEEYFRNSAGDRQMEINREDLVGPDSYKKYFSDMAKGTKIGKKAKSIHEKGYADGTKEAKEIARNMSKIKNIRRRKKEKKEREE